MTIENDIVTFGTEDFDGFSDSVKKALEGYLGDYAIHFARSLNSFVTDSRKHAKNLAAQTPFVESVLESYAAADEAKRASVESLLTDLNNQLKS